MAADVIVILKDFEVGTRIADAVTARGKTVNFPEDTASLDRDLSEETNLVVIDLEEESLHPLELVKGIRARFPGVSVVGFRPQVKKEAYLAARDAGCNWVLSRSTLMKNLPTLLLPAPGGQPYRSRLGGQAGGKADHENAGEHD